AVIFSFLPNGAMMLLLWILLTEWFTALLSHLNQSQHALPPFGAFSFNYRRCVLSEEKPRPQKAEEPLPTRQAGDQRKQGDGCTGRRFTRIQNCSNMICF
uniref:Uncharacterized protein n=1 Tax=Oryzias latipes TaxID=8090 RepID=A0A3P9JL03_ORYLA